MARITFVELPAGDLRVATRFYAQAFGMDMTAFGPSYACTMTGEGADLGLQADPEEASTSPLPVIEVEDLEAVLASVLEAGGKLVKPIFSFPGGRRFHFTDPSGNELAAMQRA